MKDYMVRIYSNEHNAWWRPNYFGYTEDKAKAGVYKMSEVQKKYPKIGFDVTAEDYLAIIDNFGTHTLSYSSQQDVTVDKITFYAILNRCVSEDICFKFEVMDEHCETNLTVYNQYDWNQVMIILKEMEAPENAKSVETREMP